MCKNSWNEEKSMGRTNKKLCNRSCHLHGSCVDIPEKHPTVGYNAVLLDFIYNRVTAFGVFLQHKTMLLEGAPCMCSQIKLIGRPILQI